MAAASMSLRSMDKGLFDEYKDVGIEIDPKDDRLLSMP
jgi:hypothetical protein